MQDKLDELREAIRGINQGSVQRALLLVLDLLNHNCECKCKQGDIAEMYEEQSVAMPEEIE